MEPIRKKTMATVSLPQHIIEEIFLRLPMKSLKRFRSLSKPLSSYIYSSQFAKRQLQRASEDPRITTENILFSTHDGIKFLRDSETFSGDEVASPLVRLDFPPKEANEPIRLLGSCNGLVAVALNANRDFFIWNPTTGAYRKLPDPVLSSEPCVGSQHFWYGFAYDLSSDDSKLFMGRDNFDNNGKRISMKTEVFSLRENTWRLALSSLKKVALSCIVRWSMIYNRDFGDKVLRMNFGGLSMRDKYFNWRVCLISSPNDLFPFQSWCVTEDCEDKMPWIRLLSGEADCSKNKRTVRMHIYGDEIRADYCQENKFKGFWIRKDPEHCEAVAYMESLVSPCFY